MGIFGVTAYSVSRQIAEIGVRLALGASHERVMRLIVLQGMKPVVVGIGTGLVTALVLSRLMQSLLFQVTTRDPLTYASVAATLTATALLACFVPARQALRTDVVCPALGVRVNLYFVIRRFAKSPSLVFPIHNPSNPRSSVPSLRTSSAEVCAGPT